jgi:hypothetical protein
MVPGYTKRASEGTGRQAGWLAARVDRWVELFSKCSASRKERKGHHGSSHRSVPSRYSGVGRYLDMGSSSPKARVRTVDDERATPPADAEKKPSKVKSERQVRYQPITYVCDRVRVPQLRRGRDDFGSQVWVRDSRVPQREPPGGS